MAIIEYKCECGRTLSTNIEDEYECRDCKVPMDMTFRKRWVGGIEDGHDEVFETGKPLKINGVRQ